MYKNKPDCPNCNNVAYVRRHGTAVTGVQRYLCCECKLTFQTKYIYFAQQRAVKDISTEQNT
ncbi:transposase [Budvicia aquatica]|uniref:transposase n=1 Tax=Budvicia aquatica TaxID=82979 RepID=UPI003D15DC81